MRNKKGGKVAAFFITLIESSDEKRA